MRCSRKPLPEPGAPRRVLGAVLAMLALLLCCAVGSAHAGGIQLRDLVLGIGDEGYELSVNADFELSPAVETLLERGVTLTFRAEMDVTRPRWYWFNERVARKAQNFRLSYQTLTRQYRVAFGDLQQSYPTLRDALRKVSRIRQWVIVDKKELKPGAQYDASFRYYLDISQLPKPLQVTAFTNSEWELSAEPRNWTFTADYR